MVPDTIKVPTLIPRELARKLADDPEYAKHFWKAFYKRKAIEDGLEIAKKIKHGSL